MRSTEDFFRVGAFAVAAKTAGKTTGIVLERAGLQADLALACFASTFPVNAC